MAYKVRNSPRRTGNIIDSVHIVIGAAVTIMAIFAIFKPVKYMFLFPVIFLLSSILTGVTCWYSFVIYKRTRKIKIAGIIYLIVTILLLALFIISAISIWGHN